MNKNSHPNYINHYLCRVKEAKLIIKEKKEHYLCREKKQNKVDYAEKYASSLLIFLPLLDKLCVAIGSGASLIEKLCVKKRNLESLMKEFKQ